MQLNNKIRTVIPHRGNKRGGQWENTYSRVRNKNFLKKLVIFNFGIFSNFFLIGIIIVNFFLIGIIIVISLMKCPSKIVIKSKNNQSRNGHLDRTKAPIQFVGYECKVDEEIKREKGMSKIVNLEKLVAVFLEWGIGWLAGIDHSKHCYTGQISSRLIKCVIIMISLVNFVISSFPLISSRLINCVIIMMIKCLV